MEEVEYETELTFKNVSLLFTIDACLGGLHDQFEEDPGDYLWSLKLETVPWSWGETDRGSMERRLPI